MQINVFVWVMNLIEKKSLIPANGSKNDVGA